ncbi:MAG: sodium-dependent transporter [Bacteroidales bacterium]|nr:sodium-dependent transporter [Bacteroidales bacterium]
MTSFSNSSDSSIRDSFGSKLGIIAAAAGSAVGLGNIWRFPYVVGENGGGAFLLIYIGFVLLIGVPVMLAEFTIGRKAQLNAFGAFRKLAPKSLWFLIGVMGIIAAFTILSFYSTVSGWTLQYLLEASKTGFVGSTNESLQTDFNSFMANGWLPVFWQLLFMGLTAFVVYSGVKNGIEKYTKFLMPLLLIIIIVLGINSLLLPGGAKGLEFLFKPDFSKITMSVVLEALGQAFFSLSIGMGVLITYGSYIQKSDNLSNTAISVSLTDTLIAILAGVAIFPAVFAFNVNPGEGPGLVFITLPLVFEQMTGGYFFAILFFLLLAIAALTSTISVLEVVVAYLVEEKKMTRLKATIISASSISLVGVICTLSLGPLKNELILFGMSFFDLMDYVSANILLPFGGFLIVVFAGWVLGRNQLHNEISNNGVLKASLFNFFLFVVKYLAPIAIALVFINQLNLFDAL